MSEKGGNKKETADNAKENSDLRKWIEDKMEKGNLEAIRAKMETLVADNIVLTEENKALEKKSTTDVMTGLLNRRGLENYLVKASGAVDRSKTTLGILFLDLDGLKKINTLGGQKAGDEYINNCAKALKRLKEELRATDEVGRWGGDEFLVVLAPVTDKGLGNVISKVSSKLEEVDVKASIGHAVRELGANSLDFINEADKLMRKKKDIGLALGERSVGTGVLELNTNVKKK